VGPAFKFSIFTFNFVVVLALAAAAEAQARTPAQAPTWSGTIGVNAIVQTGRTESQSFSVEKNLEQAPITATLSLERATLFDISVSVTHARSRLGGSVSLSSLSRSFGGNVDAQIPHPFFFNTPRLVNGSVSGLLDTELVLHLAATYQVWRSDRFDLVGFAGPSLFTVKQDLVTDVTYTDTYPYETATFVSAPTARASATSVGFNLGADLTWKLSKWVGVGALVRYAHGTTTLTPSAGNSVSANVGGLQLGGGLRLLY
jgi:hypothetical protein